MRGSVLFNLQELMRIEHDRVQAEQAAARALEQTRLAVEVSERAARQRLEQQHAEALAAMTTAPRFTLRHGLVALLVTGVIAALGYFGAIDPMLRQSRALEAQARSLADHYAREIDLLRQAPVALPAPVATDELPAVSALHVEPVNVKTVTKGKRSRSTPRTKVSLPTANEAVLDPLDSEDDDPLKGL